MQFRYVTEEKKTDPPKRQPEQSGATQDVKSLRVGHTSSEMYISFGETSVILTPSTAKNLAENLHQQIEAFEAEHGKIKLPAKPTKRKESTATRVAKSLFKSKKLGPKLLSINTKKRKHLPFGGNGEK